MRRLNFIRPAFELPKYATKFEQGSNMKWMKYRFIINSSAGNQGFRAQIANH
jgi:hypothetical protein